MRAKLLFVSFFVIFLTSCNKEKNDNGPVQAQTQEIPDNFQVTLNLTIPGDDNLHLYYTEDGSINFSEEKSIWMKVKGSTNPQDVIFQIPEDIIPTAIRIDLGYGKNPANPEIALNNFKATLHEKSIEAAGNDIFNFFYPTKENTIRIEGTNKVKRLSNDQISGPILYPNENMLAKLKLLAN